MGETRAFDTHAAVTVLTDAGAGPELAEAFVAVAGDAGEPAATSRPRCSTPVSPHSTSDCRSG